MNMFLFEFLSCQNGTHMSIQYSNATHKYYVASSAFIKEDETVKGVCAHEDTIEKAIESFNDSIKGQTLIFNYGRDDEYEINIPD